MSQIWINPREDSSYNLSTEAGWLEVRAAPHSYLYILLGTKFEAPRLLQEISGDFAVEIKMKAATDDKITCYLKRTPLVDQKRDSFEPLASMK